MRVISQALRDSARMQDCTLRIPDVCNWIPETTVLSHLPCGQKGTGMKSPDMMAVFACSDCHRFLDGSRRSELTATDLLRALAETQLYWIQAGLITIKGMKG